MLSKRVYLTLFSIKSGSSWIKCCSGHESRTLSLAQHLVECLTPGLTSVSERTHEWWINEWRRSWAILANIVVFFFLFFSPLSMSMFFILCGVYLMWQHRRKCRQPRLTCLGSKWASKWRESALLRYSANTSFKGFLIKWPLIWRMPRPRRGMKWRHSGAY